MDVIFARSRLARAADNVDGVVRLAALPDGADVLDLLFRPGRHTVELARRGHRVTREGTWLLIHS